jgi:hypothetical protein
MARTSKSQRIDARSAAAKVRTIPCVSRTTRAGADGSRLAQPKKVPSITISGTWLRAAGFSPGKPCHVRAFARRQLVVYQPD